ncbi:hypothetical protein [Listeria marthii]|uniref:hypothetical protein n=1 Tax=Listeria marthii TaxID=529731 RepID=UPI0016245396|nr:hypothetical protein [Listeria marthii]MBC2122195.1 hypothetical protein [Listeria marthii]MBC2128561.1 hypothetical protein [Listeria marthii]
MSKNKLKREREMPKIKLIWERNISNIQFFVGCIIILGILVMDYFNIPSDNGLNMMSINWSLFNILVVIFLYLLTFKNIEARTILKEKNKKDIVNALLKECYTNINSNLESLQPIKQQLKSDNINAAINIAFPNDNLIQDLIIEGLLTKEELMNYLSIKTSFKETVTFLGFSGLKEIGEDTQANMEEIYNNNKITLEIQVDSASKQLNQ